MKGKKGEWEGKGKSEMEGGARTPSREPQRGGRVGRGGSGRSELRPGKPEEVGWGAGSAGREVAQGLRLDPRRRAGARGGGSGLCGPGPPSAALRATASPPGPAPAAAQGRPSSAPSRVRAAGSGFFPGGFGVRSSAREEGEGRRCRNTICANFFLKVIFSI